MQSLDHRRSDGDPPAPHRLRVGHFAAADTRKVAIHQVRSDFSLQDGIAPIAQVLQHKQPQHHLGRRGAPAAGAALRVPPAQSLIHSRHQRVVVQDRVGGPHPRLLQIGDAFRNEAVAECALHPAGVNHPAAPSAARGARVGMARAATAAATPRGSTTPSRTRSSRRRPRPRARRGRRRRARAAHTTTGCRHPRDT